MIKKGYTTVKRNATNDELQKAIEAAIPQSVEQTKQIALRYKGADEQQTCKKIYDYLKNTVSYKADGEDQQVRLPSALMRTLQGDCKSYSVFTSAILTNLGIPHKLAYASYNPNDPTPTHIYVITDRGCIIDAVYGKFNAEKKPSYKKTKPMKISYIAGVKSRRKIGNCCNTGYAGIGATESAIDWAKRNGVIPYQNTIWLSANSPIYRKFVASQNPISDVGRLIYREIIKKNGGGIATVLNKMMVASRSERQGQANWEKMRKIEINYLENGGNPNELYSIISEGATKTPTGAYFNKLMKMKANGYNPNPAQWIAATVSLLFGKKYNEITGKITGTSGYIGDAGASAGAALTSAQVWAAMVGTTVTTLGLAYISTLGGAAPAPGETTTDGTTNAGANSGASTSGSVVLPLLLVGGAAAAYFYFNKKK